MMFRTVVVAVLFAAVVPLVTSQSSPPATAASCSPADGGFHPTIASSLYGEYAGLDVFVTESCFAPQDTLTIKLIAPSPPAANGTAAERLLWSTTGVRADANGTVALATRIPLDASYPVGLYSIRAHGAALNLIASTSLLIWHPVLHVRARVYPNATFDVRVTGYAPQQYAQLTLNGTYYTDNGRYQRGGQFADNRGLIQWDVTLPPSFRPGVTFTVASVTHRTILQKRVQVIPYWTDRP